MSRKMLLAILFLTTLILGLSGCDPIPTCDPGSLQAPDLVSPNWWEVVDGSSATLEWSYPDLSCKPEQFEIILSQDRDYSVIEITELVSGSSTTWSPPTLDVAEEYFWRVRAKVGSTYSSYSHELRSFFTLPYCSSGVLTMPSLSLPLNGGIFVRGYDSLEWEWPLTTCIPEAYKVEVSPDPGFLDTTWFGGTGNPSTRWGPGSPFTAATQYWWRIIASVNNVYGPPSLTFTFFTDPVCTGASLVAPIRLTPLHEETVPIANPEFTWSYPDPSCSPEGFHLRISSTPDMSAIVLDADNPTHAARSFQAGYLLDDCQSYYWDVAMVSESVEGPFSDVGEFSIDVGGACMLPPCGTGDIPTPDLVWPGGFETIPDLTPSLQWENPGTCDPEGYAIELSHKYDFSDIVVSGGTGTPDTSWSHSAPFEPARQYRWHVAGIVGSTLGDWSGPRSFFTGPECTSVAEVVAPVLLEPENGSVQDTLNVVFHYQAASPICLPDGVFLNLQTDPTFSGPNLMGEFPIPANTVIADPPLIDCMLYFWKGAYIQDGVYGPESDVGWFYTNESGSCPAMPVPGTAKMNTFCREGTYPEYWPDALYLFMEGDFVPVLAKNPFSNYLMTYVLGEDGFTPLKPIKPCWMLDTVRFWSPNYPKDLPIKNPPPTPVPSPTPTPTPISCHSKLGPTNCKAAGGSYDTGQKVCICP
jgi:hypothetical protein